MPATQAWLLAILGLVVVIAVVITVAVMRHAPRSRAADYLGRGQFAAARRAGVVCEKMQGLGAELRKLTVKRKYARRLERK